MWAKKCKKITFPLLKSKIRSDTPPGLRLNFSNLRGIGPKSLVDFWLVVQTFVMKFSLKYPVSGVFVPKMVILGRNLVTKLCTTSQKFLSDFGPIPLRFEKFKRSPGGGGQNEFLI